MVYSLRVTRTWGSAMEEEWRMTPLDLGVQTDTSNGKNHKWTRFLETENSRKQHLTKSEKLEEKRRKKQFLKKNSIFDPEDFRQKLSQIQKRLRAYIRLFEEFQAKNFRLFKPHRALNIVQKSPFDQNQRILTNYIFEEMKIHWPKIHWPKIHWPIFGERFIHKRTKNHRKST